MRLSENQEILMAWARKHGEITKLDADSLLKGKYLLNESKNITDDLNNLTQAGLIERIKPGLWSLKDQRPEIVQTNLF